MRVIYTTERLLRELDIIHLFFKAQFHQLNEIKQKQSPGLLNDFPIVGFVKVGNSQSYTVRPCNGKLINRVIIISEIQMFDIEQYKHALSLRLEKAVNPKYLEKQLFQLKEKASLIFGFYKENLAESNNLDIKSSNSAILVISTIPYIDMLYFDANERDLPSIKGILKYKIGGVFTNLRLAEICKIIIEFIDMFIKPYESEKLKNESDLVDISTIPYKKAEKIKSVKIANPVISLFCYVIDDAKVVQREQNENIEDFCRRICEKYNLIYTDKVRQGFSSGYTQRNIKKVIEKVLPSINDTHKDEILLYLKRRKEVKQ